MFNPFCKDFSEAPAAREQVEVTDPAELERMCTFVPDDLFVIGLDPRIKRLYWVAGLGCQGITFAPVIGSLIADWIADAGSGNPAAELLWRTG